MNSILLVDDDAASRMTVSMLLQKKGYSVEEADDGIVAIGKLQETPYTLVITDLRMGKSSGLDVLRAAKKVRPDTEVVVLTGFGSVDSAVEAMKLGAYEYLTKPVDPEELVLKVAKAFERQAMAREVKNLRDQVRKEFSLDNIIAKSKGMRQVLQMVERVAPSDATVLITGESGTGKEVIAKAIHQISPRATKLFVPINCGAMPETLLESELFGHMKGSFTGASETKKGLFEEASGGTLFLDEIGETTPATQVKLLRVLQEGEVRRVGATKSLPVDVRLIAATNQNLEEAVKTGRFREDLYYRLNVIPIHIPPLYQRPEDILPLAEFFLTRYTAKMGKHIRGLSAEVQKSLQSHRWKGNVRELENCIERAVVLARGDMITVEDLPVQVLAAADSPSAPIAALPPVSEPAGAPSLGTLKDAEKALILRTLAANEWNQARSAEILGIGRNTLWRKIKEYEIEEAVRLGSAQL